MLVSGLDIAVSGFVRVVGPKKLADVVSSMDTGLVDDRPSEFLLKKGAESVFITVLTMEERLPVLEVDVSEVKLLWDVVSGDSV
jgi:hypothetical protein